jgi:hypothetical protein
MPESNCRTDDLRGTTVRFKASDVLVPPAEEFLWRVFAEEFVEGRVVSEVASERPHEAYVAVDVGEAGDPVLVPRSKLLLARKDSDDVDVG